VGLIRKKVTMTKKTILKGTYCLIIQLKEDSTVEVGKRGSINFKKGYYVYIGSALNSLESRLKRHLRSDKKLFWHIDYLLASSNAEIDEIVFTVDDGKWECNLAYEISKGGSEVRSFGCSDCKCGSHLYYFDEFDKSVDICLKALNKFKLVSKMLHDLDG